jgi:hypothetical protein
MTVYQANAYADEWQHTSQKERLGRWQRRNSHSIDEYRANKGDEQIGEHSRSYLTPTNLWMT